MKRGLVVMLPMRVRPSIADLADETVTLPELLVPQGDTTEVVVPPVFTPPSVTPTPPTSLFVHDIIGMLPRVPGNRSDNQPHLKDSLTFHWEGEDAIPPLGVNETVTYLQRTAQFHIDKDWGGGAHGDGLMYHEVIGQNGDIYIARDYTEVTWHCGDGVGNMTSRAILVLCSTETPPNDAQIASLRQRIKDFGNIPAYPHSKWFNTQCPGDTIRAVLGY